MSKSINFIIIDNNIRDFIEYLNKNDHLSIDKYDLFKKLIEDKEFLEINSKIPKKKHWGSMSSSSSFSDLNELDSPSKERNIQLSKIDYYFDGTDIKEGKDYDLEIPEEIDSVSQSSDEHQIEQEIDNIGLEFDVHQKKVDCESNDMLNNNEFSSENPISSGNKENIDPYFEGRNSSDDVSIQNSVNYIYKNPNSRPEQNKGREYSKFEIQTIYTSLKRSYPNKRSWRSIMCSSDKCSHGYSCKYSHFRSFCAEGHINSCNNRNCETCGIAMPQMCKYWINGRCKYENGAESNEANKCHFIHGWKCFECEYKNYNFLHVCNNTINGVKCSGLRIGINGY